MANILFVIRYSLCPKLSELLVRKQNAMFEIAKQEIPNNCPSCGRVYKVAVKQVADQVSIRCSCGQLIRLQDAGGSAKRAIRDINKAASDFERALKRLGR